MRPSDGVRFAARALLGVLSRTLLMLLAMAISVAAVIVLTSLGEASRAYVTHKFQGMGTNLLIVLPGRSETTGGHPPLFGATPRDLTLEDAAALLRSRSIRAMAPIIAGAAPVSHLEREREVTILGATASYLGIRHLTLAAGSFLPEDDIERGRPVCVLGAKLVNELFDKRSPLGSQVRIGPNRFRVIGVLNPIGISIGVDLDDIAIIPVASAQALFNTESLFRIIVEARDKDSLETARLAVQKIISERHEGEEDITVITQDAMLGAFNRILLALTLTVACIGAISLLVAGILIMNVMLVAVSQRTAEIGLLKAIGASSRQVMMLFLTEAALLSCLGAALGIGTGFLVLEALKQAFPDFPMSIPAWAAGAAVGMALVTGLLFSLIPARRAALLEPVNALARRRA